MSGEMSIFDFFGGAPEAKDSLVKPIPKKEPAKGKVKSGEKAKKDPARGVRLSFPVRILGRSFSLTMEGEGDTSLKEVTEYLNGQGYEEVRHARIGYAKLGESTVLLLYDGLKASAAGDAVEGRAVICEGQLKAEFEPEEDGEEEATVKNLTELSLPGEEWRDAPLDYDATSGVAIPVGEARRLADGRFSADAEVRYLGETYAVRAGDPIETVIGEMQEGADGASLTRFGGVSILTINASAKARCPQPDRSAFGVDEKKTARKAKEKIAVPVTVRFVNFARDYHLSVGDFDGRRFVTWEELLECLKKKEPLFAQSDRKVDHLYDREAGCVSVAVISGSKGACLEHPCYRAGFSMKERIPRDVLAEVVCHFARDLSREAVAFIWHENGRYRVVYPASEDAGACGVSYEMPMIGTGDYVMTIHSHCRMPAFFSAVDDGDELSIPGLYGVLGRILEEEGEISYEGAFRVVVAPGEWLYLSEDELFEKEETDDEE